MLAISGLLMLVLFTYAAPFLILMGVFVISISMCLIAAVLLKASSILTIFLAGLGLAILSFAYQPLGPENKTVGTECQPIEDCYRPVRGGGFPAQYVIDNPGITYWGRLGFEDEFRMWALIVDVCAYICGIQLVRWILQFRMARQAGVRAGAG
jgi:hypothetical protein